MLAEQVLALIIFISMFVLIVLDKIGRPLYLLRV